METIAVLSDLHAGDRLNAMQTALRMGVRISDDDVFRVIGVGRPPTKPKLGEIFYDLRADAVLMWGGNEWFRVQPGLTGYMDEWEWQASEDPVRMMAFVLSRGLVNTGRKLAWFQAACAAITDNKLTPVARRILGRDSLWEEMVNTPDIPNRQAMANAARDIFGIPFEYVGEQVPASWLTSSVQALARSIDADGRIEDLPILADALEESGCQEAKLLKHLRDEWHEYAFPSHDFDAKDRVCRLCGMETREFHRVLTPQARCRRRRKMTHVRGCWAVDLILGQG